MTQPLPDPAQNQAPEPAVPPVAALDRPWTPVGRTENRLWTQADLDYWTRRDADGSIVRKAMDSGLLAGIGIGKRRRPYGRDR